MWEWNKIVCNVERWILHSTIQPTYCIEIHVYIFVIVRVLLLSFEYYISNFFLLFRSHFSNIKYVKVLFATKEVKKKCVVFSGYIQKLKTIYKHNNNRVEVYRNDATCMLVMVCNIYIQYVSVSVCVCV